MITVSDQKLYYQFVDGDVENEYIFPTYILDGFLAVRAACLILIIYRNFQDSCDLRRVERCQSTDSNSRRVCPLGYIQNYIPTTLQRGGGGGGGRGQLSGASHPYARIHAPEDIETRRASQESSE